MRIQHSTDRRWRSFSPKLERECEMEYIKRWQVDGDVRARNALIDAYMPLINSLARKTARRCRNEEYTDLVNEAVLSTIRAIEKFDDTKDTRLGTYAEYWIKAGFQAYLNRNSAQVRMPVSNDIRRVRTHYGRVKPIVDRELRDGKISLSGKSVNEVVAERIGVPWPRMQTILPMLNMSFVEIAGGQEAEQSKGGLKVDLCCEKLNPQESLQEKQSAARMTDLLESAIDSLDPRHSEVLRRRCLSEEKETLASIADDFGLSKERVRQIEMAGMDMIKQKLRRQKIRSFADI